MKHGSHVTRCDSCGMLHSPHAACPEPGDPDYNGTRIVCDGCGYIHEPLPGGRVCRWGSYSPNEKEGRPHGVLHECEDGHHWVEHPSGRVSPSWGFGLTAILYDQPSDRCPEPERGYSRYENGGPDHGYKCPTCGEVHYVGGCGMGVRSDPWEAKDPPCEPPAPACGKPPVRTLRWRRGDHRHGIVGGWFDPSEPIETRPGEQLALI